MIPNRVFFIYLGKDLPWGTGLAILSAKQVQKAEETVLYIENEVSGAGYDLIKNDSGILLKQIDVNSLFSDLGDNGICSHLYNVLKSPASKANLLRLALLYKEGGVYLDTDTITVKPWDDLLQYKGFCGQEPLALPQELLDFPSVKSANPFLYIAAGLRYTWSFFCLKAPHGEQIFRLAEGFFNLAVSNAVLASEPKNKLIEDAFAAINEMGKEEQLRRFRLGTRLLQQMTKNKTSENMKVLPPAYFFPVGPNVFRHIFYKNSAKRLNKILLPQTRVVHWYNGIEKIYLHQKFNQKWIEENPTTAFAELARNVLSGGL
ncbi:MAG: hypothetical protein LBU89_07690 [Fibromonadaceae bacterium]|jgi:hypothetical protein|nr:hypothetical protein [Fibromonadaceae bacterium]